MTTVPIWHIAFVKLVKNHARLLLRGYYHWDSTTTVESMA